MCNLALSASELYRHFFVFLPKFHEVCICKILANHPLGKPGHSVAFILVCSTGGISLSTVELFQLAKSTQKNCKEQVAQHIDERSANEVPTKLWNNNDSIDLHISYYHDWD